MGKTAVIISNFMDKKQTMNIIYFVPNITIAGGIFRIVSDKMNFLTENIEGQLFLAYYGNGQEKPIYPLHPNILLLPIDIDWKVGFGKKILRILKNISVIRHILKKNKIDIAINANAPLLIWILPFICRRIKKVHEFHFSYEGQQILDKQIFKSQMKIYLIQSLRKFCLGRFNKVVALNNSDKEKSRLYNVIVIPNFTSVEIRQIQKVKSNTIVSVGRLELQKGYDRLISAWALVAKKHPDWQLEIWGEGSLRKCLQQQIDTLQLSSVVHLKGVSHNIGEVYAHSSFFVMSSLYEGFPLVLVEAMNCGLPCVSFDITGANSIIENGKNGFLVPDNNIDALTNACTRLMGNKVLLEEMGKQAYISSARFSKPKVMQKWLDLFEGLIEE